MGADFNYPPSGLNLTTLKIPDLPYKDKLTLGCTDILNDKFLEKLEIILRSENIDLITIDAESITGSLNFEFIETYLPFV